MFKKSSHKKLAHCALLLGIMSTFGFESFADNIPVPTGDQVKEGLIIPAWKNISGFEPYWVCDITGQVKMGDYLWQANVQLSSRSKEKPKEVSSNEIQVLDIRSVDQLTVSPHDRVLVGLYKIEVDNIIVDKKLAVHLSHSVPKACHPVVTSNFTGFSDC